MKNYMIKGRKKKKTKIYNKGQEEKKRKKYMIKDRKGKKEKNIYIINGKKEKKIYVKGYEVRKLRFY